jgi:hypothetical protein
VGSATYLRIFYFYFSSPIRQAALSTTSISMHVIKSTDFFSGKFSMEIHVGASRKEGFQNDCWRLGAIPTPSSCSAVYLHSDKTATDQ